MNNGTWWKKRFSSPKCFCNGREHIGFFTWLKASKQPTPTQLTFYRRRRVYERAHVDKISLDVISLKCEASENVQFSTCYDPILEGEGEKFVFLKNKNIFEEKKYAAFLVLLGSTCVQKLRQFEFLTLAIKISFLFDFCTDVLLRVVSYIW